MDGRGLSNREIYAAALEISSAEERNAYLNEVCGEHTARRAAIDRLLAAHQANQTNDLDRAMRQLERPPTATLPPGPSIDSQSVVPPTIDRYKIRELIGEGGMGLVYVAEQTEPVRRKVAVKVIKPGMDSRHVIARFEAERQALAVMDHPSIARVLDGATLADGRPYFVMDLVQGVPITQFCDDARFANRERLKLFIDVCSAVQHAHQKGIIHRDLKPTNIMVTMSDDRPIAKVIDFGIAKALTQPLTENSIYTNYGQMIGTPLYMSPEQAQFNAKDVDTRSDVYSLGVVLYQLLTGSTPFTTESLQGTDFDEFRRLIREVDPPLPSSRVKTLEGGLSTTVAERRSIDVRSLSRSLTGELDWIVMKALEKDRRRRYQSPRELADDIQRYLSNEPIQARPTSVVYRAHKLVRRHRAVLSAAVLVLVTLVAGTVVSVWQAVEARRAQQATLASNALARSAVDDMYTRFAERWLAEEGNASDTQREFLEKALAFYEVEAAQAFRDSAVQVERLKAKQRVHALQMKLGQLVEAERGFRELAELCRSGLEQDPTRHDVAALEIAATERLGSLVAKLGKDGAGAYFDRAAVLARQLAQKPTSLQAVVKSDLAQTCALLGSRLQQYNRVDNAESMIQVSLQLWNDLLTDDPDNWDYRVGYAGALGDQGLQRMWLGDRNAEAKASYEIAKEYLIQLQTERPGDRRSREILVGVYLSLGVLARWDGDLQESIEHTSRGVAVARQLVQEFPTDQDSLRGLTIVLQNLSSFLIESDARDEAQPVIDEWFECANKLSQRNPSVIEYLGRFQLASQLKAGNLLEQQDVPGATSVARLLRERIEQTMRLQGTHQNLELATYAENARFLEFECLIEQARYGEAIQIMRDSAFDPYRFVPDRLHKKTDTDTDVRFLDRCIQDIKWRLRPLCALELAVELASLDSADSSQPPRELVEKVREFARRCESEAHRVHKAWRARLKTAELSGHDLLIELYRHAGMDNDAEESETKLVQRLRREVAKRLAPDLFRKLEELGSDVEAPLLSYAVGELVAGPEYVRDPDLALRLARRQTEASALRRRDLAWALYRKGDYEECVQFTLDDFEAETAAVLAMALHRLGRQKEAAAYLGQRYEEALAAQLKERDNDDPNHLIVPTAANLSRLDRELREVLKDER